MFGLISIMESLVVEYGGLKIEIPRDFEEDIILYFYAAGKRTPRTGLWIRGHLLDVGEDYPYRMWKFYNQFCLYARKRGAFLPTVSYVSFVRYIHLLKDLGLIEKVREEPSKKKGIMRSYYKVVEANLRSHYWINPYSVYESWRRWKEKGFKTE